MPYNTDAYLRFRWPDPQQVAGLQALATCLPFDTVMAEVGVYAGASTEIFLTSGRVRTVVAIDAWQDYADADRMAARPFAWQDVRDTFDVLAERWNTVRPDSVLTYPHASPQAAGAFPDGWFDFIYLDACHTYAAVRADLAAWLPKIKAGGLIGGHDHIAAFPGVAQAVAELALGAPQTFTDGSWLLAVP